MTDAISAGRAAAVLVRLRWRRVRNRLLTRPAKTAAPGAPRTATAGRGRSAWVMLFLGLYLPVLFLQNSTSTLKAMAKHEHLDLAAALSGHVADALAPIVAAEIAILMLAVVLTSMASRELSAPEWDLEWLVTLPVPRRTLLGVRVLERALVNPAGLIVIGPFACATAWRHHAGVSAALLGIACALLLLLVVGAIWVLAEGALRMRLSPPSFRNAQALLTVLAFAGYFLGVSPMTGSVDVVYSIAHALAPLWRWSPPGLAYRALTAPDARAAAVAFGGLALEALAAAGLAVAATSHLIRHGVVTAGAREGGRRGPAPRPLPAVASPPRRPSWLSPVQRRGSGCWRAIGTSWCRR